MKCGLKDALFNILLIIFSITVEGEGYQSNSLQTNFASPKRISSNAYQGLESFPDLDYLDLKHHKIVKKQMGISNEMIPAVAADNVENNGGDKKLSEPEKNSFAPAATNKKENENKENLEEFVTKCALYMNRRKRALGIMSRLFQGLKGFNIQTYMPFQKKRTKKDIHGNGNKKFGDTGFDIEMTNGKDYEGQPCKHFFRVPDKCDCRYYYECEAQPDGCMKIRHKKCKDDEMFSMTYSECLNPGFLKAMRKSKREPPKPGPRKKIDMPEMPQEDSEPANEWLDATQEVAQKVPSEFKPKPKLKLKIYHLRCKKKAGEIPRRETAKHSAAKVAKSGTLQGFVVNPDHRSSLHRIHKHPRSFLLHTNRKETDGLDEDATRNFMEDDLEEDEEEEEYDEDEEAEDNSDEDYEKHNKKESSEDKKRRQERLKELIKTGKGTIKSKAKYSDEPSSLLRTLDNFKASEKESKAQDAESFEDRESPKVLIDANIRVDGEITDALTNILNQNKEKSMKEVKNSIPEYLSDK